MQQRKRGNPHRLPKQQKRGHPAPVPVAPPIDPMARVWLTLHDNDPITGNRDSLSTLFYEFYRGYTIYSTPEGRCCIHGTQGCIKLRGQFVCCPDVEEAKTLIKRLRAEGYTSSDRVERNVPEGKYVCLNSYEQDRTLTGARPIQCVS